MQKSSLVYAYRAPALPAPPRRSARFGKAEYAATILPEGAKRSGTKTERTAFQRHAPPDAYDYACITSGGGIALLCFFVRRRVGLLALGFDGDGTDGSLEVMGFRQDGFDLADDDGHAYE